MTLNIIKELFEKDILFNFSDGSLNKNILSLNNCIKNVNNDISQYSDLVLIMHDQIIEIDLISFILNESNIWAKISPIKEIPLPNLSEGFLVKLDNKQEELDNKQDELNNLPSKAIKLIQNYQRTYACNLDEKNILLKKFLSSKIIYKTDIRNTSGKENVIKLLNSENYKSWVPNRYWINLKNSVLILDERRNSNEKKFIIYKILKNKNKITEIHSVNQSVANIFIRKNKFKKLEKKYTQDIIKICVFDCLLPERNYPFYIRQYFDRLQELSGRMIELKIVSLQLIEMPKYEELNKYDNFWISGSNFGVYDKEIWIKKMIEICKKLVNDKKKNSGNLFWSSTCKLCFRC